MKKKQRYGCLIIIILTAILCMSINKNYIKMNEIVLNIKNTSSETQTSYLFDNSESERLPPTLYASQNNSNGSSGYRDTYVGQSFIASKNTTIKSFEVYVISTLNGEDISIRIYKGLPDIVSQPVEVIQEYSDLKVVPEINKFDVDFDIISGETYAFALIGTNHDSIIHFRSTISSSFNDGVAVFHDGTTLTSLSDRDLFFNLYEQGDLMVDTKSIGAESYNKINNSLISKPLFVSEIKLKSTNPEQYLSDITITNENLFGYRVSSKKSILESSASNKNQNISEIKFNEPLQIGGDNGNSLGFEIQGNSEATLFFSVNKKKDEKKPEMKLLQTSFKSSTDQEKNNDKSKINKNWLWLLLLIPIYIIYKNQRNKA